MWKPFLRRHRVVIGLSAGARPRASTSVLAGISSHDRQPHERRNHDQDSGNDLPKKRDDLSQILDKDHRQDARQTGAKGGGKKAGGDTCQGSSIGAARSPHRACGEQRGGGALHALLLFKGTARENARRT